MSRSLCFYNIIHYSPGAEINAQTEETQETALTLSCCGGFMEVTDFLLKAGADIELGCSTPLMEAAQEGHLELVKFLINEGEFLRGFAIVRNEM
jgi:ankyrin repeat protein